MDTYKQKLTRLQSAIFRLLTKKTGEPLNQREIATTLQVSATAVHNALSKIEKEKWITIKKNPKMNLTAIELNTNNVEAIALKRIENLKLIQESKLTEHLEEKHPGSTIILFGSYSRGEDTINSDIDITIIGSKSKQLDLTIFEKRLERKIYVQHFENFEKITKNLKSNLINGIILSGAI